MNVLTIDQFDKLIRTDYSIVNSTGIITLGQTVRDYISQQLNSTPYDTSIALCAYAFSWDCTMLDIIPERFLDDPMLYVRGIETLSDEAIFYMRRTLCYEIYHDVMVHILTNWDYRFICQPFPDIVRELLINNGIYTSDLILGSMQSGITDEFMHSTIMEYPFTVKYDPKKRPFIYHYFIDQNKTRDCKYYFKNIMSSVYGDAFILFK
jgi:hypothetical protein